MKISTAFLALPMFLLAAPVNAQVGVVAGFVSSNLSIDDFDDTESRTGFAVGLTMSRWMGPSLSFNPEVLYITKGAAFEDEEEKLAYLEVPLMFRYNIMTSGGEFRPFITAGPTIGYLLSCDFTDEGESFDCGDGHKKLDIGIGLECPLEPTQGWRRG